MYNLWMFHAAVATSECRCRVCVHWTPRCAVAATIIDFACTRNWPAAVPATNCPVPRLCWRLTVETSLRRKLQHFSFCAFGVVSHATWNRAAGVHACRGRWRRRVGRRHRRSDVSRKKSCADDNTCLCWIRKEPDCSVVPRAPYTAPIWSPPAAPTTAPAIWNRTKDCLAVCTIVRD